MPIESTSWWLAALLLGLLPMMAMAQGQVLIRHASQLAQEGEVAKLGKSYRAASAAYVVYDRCATELKITPENKEFIKHHYDTLAADYIQAFHDTYVMRFRASPPQALSEDFTRYITNEQKYAVKSILSNIERRGCQQHTLERIVQYYTDMQKGVQATSAPASATTTPIETPKE